MVPPSMPCVISFPFRHPRICALQAIRRFIDAQSVPYCSMRQKRISARPNPSFAARTCHTGLKSTFAVHYLSIGFIRTGECMLRSKLIRVLFSYCPFPDCNHLLQQLHSLLDLSIILICTRERMLRSESRGDRLRAGFGWEGYF